MSAREGIDGATLERLRQSGIRIDRDGELIHEGEVIRHGGLRAAIFRWLDRGEDGRFVLRLDAGRFAYVTVDDTPLVVRAAAWRGDDLTLSLSDGTEETLRPGSLRVEAEGVLRCLAREGRLPARLSTSAAAVLGERMSDEDGTAVLRIGGRRYRLRPGEGGPAADAASADESAKGR